MIRIHVANKITKINFSPNFLFSRNCVNISYNLYHLLYAQVTDEYSLFIHIHVFNTTIKCEFPCFCIILSNLRNKQRMKKY